MAEAATNAEGSFGRGVAGFDAAFSSQQHEEEAERRRPVSGS